MKRDLLAVSVLSLLVVGCTSSQEPIGQNGGSGSQTTTGSTTTTGSATTGASTTGGTTSGTTTGGTPGGSTTGGTSGGGPAEARKQTAMDALSSFWNALPHQDLASDNAQVLAYLSNSSDFQNVTQFQGLITTQFFDGEVYVYISNQPYPAQIGESTNTTVSSNLLTKQEYPTGRNFVLVNTLPLDDFANPVMSDALGAAYRYANSALGNVTLSSPLQGEKQNSKGVTVVPYNQFSSGFKNIDVLVWTGHSAGDQNSGQFFLQAPLDPTDTALQPDANNKVDNGAVVRSAVPILTANLGNFHLGQSFALTPTFFTKYATFRPGSVVLMDACLSTHPSSSALQAALKTAGASYYAGWSEEAAFEDMAETTSVFFDEVLGNNALWADYHTVKDPSRPWSYPVTITDLGKLQRKQPGFRSQGSYALDHTYQPYNVVQLLTSQFGLQALDKSDVTYAGLRPSVQNVSISESALNLTIKGSFSDSQQSGDGVSYNGADLTVAAWNNTQITCSGVPVSGGGNVVVTASGNPSNAVPVTEWKLVNVSQSDHPNYSIDTSGTPLSYNPKTVNNLQRVVFSFGLRVDAHGFRTDPEANVTGLQNYDSEGGSSANDDSVSGTTAFYYPSSGGTTVLTYTDSANPVSLPATGENGGGGTFGTADVLNHTLSMNFLGGFVDNAIKTTVSTDGHTFLTNLVPTAGNLTFSLDPTTYVLSLMGSGIVNYTPTNGLGGTLTGTGVITYSNLPPVKPTAGVPTNTTVH